METISIPLSKGKLVLIAVGSFALLGLCLGLLFYGDQVPRMNSIFIKIVVAVGGLFFALCGVFGVQKFFDNKPGLIIDCQGIVDNSSAIAAGRIPWEEITGIRISEIASEKFLTILLLSPEKYAQGKGQIRAWLNSINTKMTGSPINISANALKISLNDLSGHLMSAWTSFKK